MPNLAYACFYCSRLSAILYSCCIVFFYLKLYTILGSLVFIIIFRLLLFWREIILNRQVLILLSGFLTNTEAKNLNISLEHYLFYNVEEGCGFASLVGAAFHYKERLILSGKIHETFL